MMMDAGAAEALITKRCSDTSEEHEHWFTHPKQKNLATILFIETILARTARRPSVEEKDGNLLDCEMRCCSLVLYRRRAWLQGVHGVIVVVSYQHAREEELI